jgi:hypothetical protein
VCGFLREGEGELTATGTGKAKEIALGNDFGDVAVTVNGVRVEVHTDGSILAYTNRSVDAYTNGTVQVHPAANDDAKAKAAPEIGDEMEDGTILGGYYEGKPLYATPRDAPGTYTFNEAAKYASSLDANGHHDYHVPSKGELNVLWENRDKGKLKGTFNVTGSDPAGWYWSSSQGSHGNAWTQRFSDADQLNDNKSYDSSLRCVR